jgi:alkylated DNA repair dioxygenase AlkB
MNKEDLQVTDLFEGRIQYFPRAINPVFMDEVMREVQPFLKCQRTFSKGWPGRATQDHKMARFGDRGVTYSFKDQVKQMNVWKYGPDAYLTYYRDFIAELIGWQANCVVANVYTPEGDLFPHNDSTHIPQLGKNPTIVSVSFGETRHMCFWELDENGKRKPMPDGRPYFKFPLEAGDILVMENDFDHKFHHGILPEPERKGIRLSLTYRKHLHDV